MFDDAALAVKDAAVVCVLSRHAQPHPSYIAYLYGTGVPIFTSSICVSFSYRYCSVIVLIIISLLDAY